MKPVEKEALKFSDSSVMEGFVSVRAVIAGGENGVNDRRVEKVLYDGAKEISKARELSYLRSKAEEHGFILEKTDAAVIDAMTTGTTHGGIAALCSGRSAVNVTSLKPEEHGFYVMLDGIEDPYNFGYCLRSLFAAGVRGIILGHRNWMSAAGVVARASAGASELFSIAEGEPEETVAFFRSAGYSVIAADGGAGSVPVYDTELKYPLLLIIGGEKRGIKRAVLESADRIVKLTYGRVFCESLSAASAASVIAFEIYRQNRAHG